MAPRQAVCAWCNWRIPDERQLQRGCMFSGLDANEGLVNGIKVLA